MAKISNFVDLVKIHLNAGNGGDGLVHFRREKYIPRGGPDGGDGGKGGSIWIMGDPSLKTLLDFRYRKIFKATSGAPGGKNKRSGKRGEDLILKVPAGTIIYDDKDNSIIGEIISKEDKLLVARGGRGGRGNAHFASSRNRTPQFREEGEKGEEKVVRLELKLIGDVGIIGYPNVGKTTLLKALTGVEAKIADYPFTTLTPNLGVLSSSFIIVDIPGIIEGAHLGRGMGLAFLRHIERTQLLLFVLDVNSPHGEKDYENLQNELCLYKKELLLKKGIIVLNKIDLCPFDPVFKYESNQTVFKVSALKEIGIEELIEGIKLCLEKKK